jgi:hypothetical protein
MNSNSDYTICNLDSHTYSSNFIAESVGSTGYSYANVNNGLADTGQLGYGASASLQQSGAVDLAHSGHQSGHLYHHGNTGSVLSPTTPPPGPYHSMHPGTCGPQTGYDYYAPHHSLNGMDVPNSTSVYSYPEHPAGHGHQPPGLPPVSTAAYGIQNSGPNSGSQASDQGPVTTYKWMTVKRGNSNKSSGQRVVDTPQNRQSPNGPWKQQQTQQQQQDFGAYAAGQPNMGRTNLQTNN